MRKQKKGILSLLIEDMRTGLITRRMLLRQAIRRAASFARPRLGSSIAARMAMIAITTSNSIRVKARCDRPKRPLLPMH